MMDVKADLGDHISVLSLLLYAPERGDVLRHAFSFGLHLLVLIVDTTRL